MYESPVSIIYDSNGNAVAVNDGNSVTNTQSGFITAGVDNSNKARFIKVSDSGNLLINTNTYSTFSGTIESVSLSNNKSLLSIVNTGTKIIKIAQLSIQNTQSVLKIGVNGSFVLRRITGHSSGTSVTTDTFDLSDSLDAGVSVYTGSTVTGQFSSIIKKMIVNTSGANNNIIRQNEKTYYEFLTVIEDGKLLTLNQNQGITLNFETNSSAGLFDISFIITQQ